MKFDRQLSLYALRYLWCIFVAYLVPVLSSDASDCDSDSDPDDSDVSSGNVI